MARTKGSKNKTKRAKARNAYETYSSWYDTYTKGDKAGWFSAKLSKDDFTKKYEDVIRYNRNAKAVGLPKITNPARSIAMSQEYVDRKFEKRYKEYYGEQLPDISDKAAREQIFENFVEQLLAEGKSYDEARKEFEKYFY